MVATGQFKCQMTAPPTAEAFLHICRLPRLSPLRYWPWAISTGNLHSDKTFNTWIPAGKHRGTPRIGQCLAEPAGIVPTLDLHRLLFLFTTAAHLHSRITYEPLRRASSASITSWATQNRSPVRQSSHSRLPSFSPLLNAPMPCAPSQGNFKPIDHKY